MPLSSGSSANSSNQIFLDQAKVLVSGNQSLFPVIRYVCDFWARLARAWALGSDLVGVQDWWPLPLAVWLPPLLWCHHFPGCQKGLLCLWKEKLLPTYLIAYMSENLPQNFNYILSLSRLKPTYSRIVLQPSGKKFFWVRNPSPFLLELFHWEKILKIYWGRKNERKRAWIQPHS